MMQSASLPAIRLNTHRLIVAWCGKPESWFKLAYRLDRKKVTYVFVCRGLHTVTEKMYSQVSSSNYKPGVSFPFVYSPGSFGGIYLSTMLFTFLQSVEAWQCQANIQYLS